MDTSGVLSYQGEAFVLWNIFADCAHRDHSDPSVHPYDILVLRQEEFVPTANCKLVPAIRSDDETLRFMISDLLKRMLSVDGEEDVATTSSCGAEMTAVMGSCDGKEFECGEIRLMAEV